MRVMRWLLTRAVLACWSLTFLLGASPAKALPVEQLTGFGTAQITVFNGLAQIGQASGVPLTASLTLDFGTQSIDAFQVDLAPNVSLSLTSPYGGYDEITIESASIQEAPGYGAILPPVSTGFGFTTFLGSLEVDGAWGAEDSSGVNPPQSGIAITYPIESMTAVVGTAPSVSVMGVTLNALSGAVYGESQDLRVLASFQVSPLTVIPEPGSGILLAAGLGALASARRRKRLS